MPKYFRVKCEAIWPTAKAWLILAHAIMIKNTLAQWLEKKKKEEEEEEESSSLNGSVKVQTSPD